MSSTSCWILTLVWVAAFISQSEANRITKECKNSVYSSSPSVVCPGPEDDQLSIFCCQKRGVNGESTAYCCNFPQIDIDDPFDEVEDLPTPQPAKLIRGLAKIIGVALGIIAFIVLICVICCCCCPFCLLAKRRQRGHIIRQNNPPDGATQGQGGTVPMVAQSGQVPYPQQGGQHPPQNQPYYGNQGQGYQQGGGPGYPAYPPMDQPPPYPGHPADAGGAGPEYGKPPAYNPSAAPPL